MPTAAAKSASGGQVRLIRSPPAPARATRRRPSSSRPRAAARREGRPPRTRPPRARPRARARAPLRGGTGAGYRDRTQIGLDEAGDERAQRRLAGATPADDPHPCPGTDAEVEGVEHALAAEHADDAVRDDGVAATERRGIRFDQQLRQAPPFAGMTRIRFYGYAPGSALSAPRA